MTRKQKSSRARMAGRLTTRQHKSPKFTAGRKARKVAQLVRRLTSRGE